MLRQFWRLSRRKGITKVILCVCSLWMIFAIKTSLIKSNSNIDDLLLSPLRQDDPLLIKWIQQNMVPPSKKDYTLSLRLSGLHEDETPNISPSQQFILDAFEEYLDKLDISGGTFIEAGAYDGEFLSNTLSLEVYFNFTGILIEPNPSAYENLLTKNRKAWALNSCLSDTTWATEEMFDEANPNLNTNHVIGSAAVDKDTEWHTNFASSGLTKYSKINTHSKMQKQYPVQCIPLYSIMKALDWNHVDILSLDVQRAEMEILKTIPWNEISFSLMAIEAPYPQELINFLEPKGYVIWRSLGEDHIFINSKLHTNSGPKMSDIDKLSKF